MAGGMGFYAYVSDNGTTYRIKADASNSTAAGGSAAAGTEPWYPRGWVPRYILAQNAAGNRRRVTVPDPTDGVWTGSTTTIALEQVGSATSVSYTITGRFGEKRTSRG